MQSLRHPRDSLCSGIKVCHPLQCLHDNLYIYTYFCIVWIFSKWGNNWSLIISIYIYICEYRVDFFQSGATDLFPEVASCCWIIYVWNFLFQMIFVLSRFVVIPVVDTWQYDEIPVVIIKRSSLKVDVPNIISSPCKQHSDLYSHIVR